MLLHNYNPSNVQHNTNKIFSIITFLVLPQRQTPSITLLLPLELTDRMQFITKFTSGFTTNPNPDSIIKLSPKIYLLTKTTHGQQRYQMTVSRLSIGMKFRCSDWTPKATLVEGD